MNKATADMCNVAMEDIKEEALVSALIEGMGWERIHFIGYEIENDAVTCQLASGDYIVCGASRLIAVRKKAEVTGMPIL